MTPKQTAEDLIFKYGVENALKLVDASFWSAVKEEIKKKKVNLKSN